MKKETILLVVVTLVVGILGGVIFTNIQKESTAPRQAPAAAAAVNYQQNIMMLEGIVGKEPDNRNAWVQLGNNYFDSNQPMKAIEAYDKALELDGNDPDVLTDQGIMFRQVGWFDKAIDNFIKANKLNPKHENSLFFGAWNRYLELVPTGQGADKVRTMIDHMKNGHG